MKIQFVSDYVCPYCYVAKKPLLKACQGRDVELEWVPFELSRPPKPHRIRNGRCLRARLLAIAGATSVGRISPVLICTAGVPPGFPRFSASMSGSKPSSESSIK